MGDMGEIFNAMRRQDKERRERNLESAYSQGTDGWTVHCSTHWSRDLAGQRLDYWPSRNKFRWRGKTHTGDVHGFIRNRLQPKETK
jgi:hypothetical protein